jgi:SPP1 family predicted phage head-tail adaptor
MRAGNRDRLITIQGKTATADSFGEPIEAWVDVDTVWAEKKDLRGTELFAARQEVASVDTRFRILYRTDVTALNRILYEGIYYDIAAVLEIGRREGLEIYASKGEA